MGDFYVFLGMSRIHLGGVWGIAGGCLRDVCGISGGCQGISGVSARCMEDV